MKNGKSTISPDIRIILKTTLSKVRNDPPPPPEKSVPTILPEGYSGPLTRGGVSKSVPLKLKPHLLFFPVSFRLDKWLPCHNSKQGSSLLPILTLFTRTFCWKPGFYVIYQLFTFSHLYTITKSTNTLVDL